MGANAKMYLSGARSALYHARSHTQREVEVERLFSFLHSPLLILHLFRGRVNSRPRVRTRTRPFLLFACACHCPRYFLSFFRPKEGSLRQERVEGEKRREADGITNEMGEQCRKRGATRYFFFSCSFPLLFFPGPAGGERSFRRG